MSWGALRVRQNHPNAVGYMETWAPFLSSNQSDERKTRNTFWMAISCYFWYQTSFCIKCIFRRIFVRDYRTDKGILGFRKNTKFIVVNHFSFFQTLQLVPRSHAVDGCSLSDQPLSNEMLEPNPAWPRNEIEKRVKSWNRKESKISLMKGHYSLSHQLFSNEMLWLDPAWLREK